MDLGFEDKVIAAAYLLCLLSCLLCVIYGALRWNTGDEAATGEDVQWASEEKKIEDEF